MRRLEYSLIFLIALLALGVSVAWFTAEKNAWRVSLVERLVLTGKQVDPKKLSWTLEQAANLESALLLVARPHAHALLSARLVATDQNLTPVRYLDIMHSARASAKRALAREPADAHAWARLAYFKHVLDGPAPEVLTALRLSIYFAPSQRNLILWRLGMAAQNQAYWDEKTAHLVRSQIRKAWRMNPRSLVIMAVTHELVPLVRVALVAEPEELQRLKSMVK